jgi:hypothetical protein
VEKIVEEKESSIFTGKSEMEENKVTWTSKGYQIGLILSVLQVLSGIASFVTQAGHVMAFTFKQTTIGLYTPIVITISQLIGTLLSVPMLKYFEWRKMTIIGGFTLAFLDAMIGMLLYLYEQQKGNENAQNYILLLTCIAIMAFMFTFGMSLGSSVWPYISFMMPSHGVMVASVVNWLLAGSSIIAFSFVTNEMTSPYVMLFIYCSVTFVLTAVFAGMSKNIKGLSVRKAQMQLQ